MAWEPDDPAAKLVLACELFDTGVAMMRENILRRMPNAPDEAIAEALAAWLHERPGAEFGDAPGVPGT